MNYFSPSSFSSYVTAWVSDFTFDGFAEQQEDLNILEDERHNDLGSLDPEL